jgi:flagellar L-ring protein precursor FlgH
MKSKIILLMLIMMNLASCATNEPQKLSDWQPQVHPVAPQAPVYENGSLFQTRSLSLFEDAKPFRVGDVITIMLSESTKSSKKAATDTKKDDDISFDVPSVLGATPMNNGNTLLAADIAAARAFKGEGNSSQSNSLSGEITVTVVEILPNGNLVVKGEKWFTLNQGKEYIRIAGVVRPQDVASNNVVVSTKLADAQIAYSGEGFVHDSNTQGWLSQFFSSKWWPF